MVKKAVTIRLDEDTLQEIDDRGKRSDVIRNIIESSLRPKPPQIKIVTKEIIKEVPVEVEVIKLVRFDPTNWDNFNKNIERDVIKDDIRKGMPKWYLDARIKDFERKYNEEFK